MVSYLTDTDKVEAYNGTNWVSVAPTTSQGLTLINTTSFSAVASASLPADTFTSTYDNYKIIFKLSAVTSDGVVYVKLRASGTDSSAGYYWGLYGVVAGGVSAIVNNASNVTTGFLVMEDDAGSSAKPTFAEMTFLNPKVAEPTSMIGQNISSTNAGSPVGLNIWGLHTASTAYDSASFISSAGNISGSITVYGINK
jgi:hypothetical protein